LHQGTKIAIISKLCIWARIRPETLLQFGPMSNPTYNTTVICHIW